MAKMCELELSLRMLMLDLSYNIDKLLKADLLRNVIAIDAKRQWTWIKERGPKTDIFHKQPTTHSP